MSGGETPILTGTQPEIEALIRLYHTEHDDTKQVRRMRETPLTAAARKTVLGCLLERCGAHRSTPYKLDENSWDVRAAKNAAVLCDGTMWICA